MITGLLSAIGSVLGAGSTIEKGMDLIDKMHTSDAEAIEAKTKSKTNLLSAYAPFKVAQRWIAITFTLNFIAAFWVAVGLWAFDKDLDGFLSIMAAFNLGWIMLAIVGFYFGGGAFESIGTAVKTGKGK